MRFDQYIPHPTLQPYIKQYVVTEQALENQYKVFPTAGMVIGFQYRGKLSTIDANQVTSLAAAGITGITDQYKLFHNSAGIGTVLVYFTETGFTHFASHPAHELFNQSIALDYLFDKSKVAETEEKLGRALTDKQRVKVMDQFFLSQLKTIATDKLIIEAVRLIYQSKGMIKIKMLNERLFISQSPFEKRFRKLVGTTPKKFASIVRFNTVLDELKGAKSLLDICYENNFFDQAHFTKDFHRFTGETPEQFRKPSE